MRNGLATALLLLIGTMTLSAQPASDKNEQSVKTASSEFWIVEGDVIDADGPVSDANVRFTWAGRPMVARTDARGHYLQKGETGGKYSIWPRKEGYAEGRRQQLTLRPGMRISGIDFRLARTAVISGRVVDTDRQPIQGVEVSAYVKRFRNGIARYQSVGGANRTNDLGRFRISGLSSGLKEDTYYILAEVVAAPRSRRKTSADDTQPMLSPVSTFFPNSLSVAGATPIQVRSGQQVEMGDTVVQIRPTYCISATLMSERDDDVDIVFLLYQSEMGFESRPATGRVRRGEQVEICGQREGEYNLVITSLPETKSSAPPKETGFGRTELYVSKRNVDLGILKALAGEPLMGKLVVEGSSTERKAIPPNLIVGLIVHNRPTFYAEIEGLTTNQISPSGEFRLLNVFHDQYRLRDVDGLPAGYYVKSARQPGRDLAREPIQLGSELTITLATDGPAIAGQAIGSDGRPTSNASVILIARHKHAHNASIIQQQTDQEGRFSIESGLPPGDYTLLGFSNLPEGQGENPEFLRPYLGRGRMLSLQPHGREVVSLLVVNLTHQ